MEKRTVIHVVDADPRNRAALARSIFELGHHAEVYEDALELISHMPRHGIVLAHDDAPVGGIAGLVDRMADSGAWLPIIAMEAEPDIERVVAAMRAGAFDYLAQPPEPGALEAAIARVTKEASVQADQRRRALDARSRIAMLSTREREVLDRLAQGSSNKAIARDLDISPRTVEIHRSNMMDKLGARHAAEAVRLRLEASMGDRLN